MQSKSRPLDDISNLLTNAVGAVKGVGDEVKAVGRAQVEKMIADMDLVSRDEFEILKARLDSLQADNESMRAEIAALKPKQRKSAAKKST